MNKNVYISVCILCAILVFGACKEDSGLIGLDVQPQDEFLNTDYFDTTTIAVRSSTHDSLITSNIALNMLGYIQDPVFGKTQAGIYTQFRLSSYNADFGENVTVDSVVLTLVYGGHYGDTLNSFLVRVYELTEGMEKSKNYFANSKINYVPSSNLTENSNLYISPKPNTRQDTSISSNCLRVRLDTNFAKTKFISQSGSDVVYKSDANFVNYFKGLLITAEAMTGNGCIVSLNMTHTNSNLTIYYSNDRASNQKYTFKLNDSTAHFGATDHFDYADAETNLKAQLNGDSSSGTNVLYAQAGAGVKVLLNFPYIKDMFNNQKVIIHRASLVINHLDDNLANYIPPDALGLTSSSVLPDFLLELATSNSGYFGGGYNKTTKEYRFHITQYIQNLVDGRNEDAQLNLITNPAASLMKRLKIYGTQPNELDKRLRLEVYYTVVE